MTDNNHVGGINQPFILYKYMTLERFCYSKDYYLAGKVWFSDWNGLNDPFEGIPQEARKDKRFFYTLLEQTKICSLSKCSSGKDAIRLWSHYADMHKGVCVGYNINPDLLRDNFEIIAINYQDTIPFDTEYDKYIDEISFMDAHVIFDISTTWMIKRGLIKEILSRKLDVWKNEHEYRLILYSSSTGMKRVGKTRQIILGCRCDYEFDNKTKEYCEKHGIKISRSELDTFHGEIIIKNYNEDHTIKNKIKPTVPKQSGNTKWSYNITDSGVVFWGCRNKDFIVTDKGFLCECSKNTLKDIVIPSEIQGKPVVSIARFTFADCRWLRSIGIPQSVEVIGKCAFRNCIELTNINIPTNVRIIGVMAFAGCTRLVNINIPEGVRGIEASAFSDCSGLTDIVIPASVEHIELHAFEYCVKLTNVTFKGNNTALGGSMYYENTGRVLPAFDNGDSLKTEYTRGGAGTYKLNDDTWIKQ